MLLTIDAHPPAKQPWALEKLPPFSQVALKVMELLAKDDVEVRQITELIKADPVFASELLRVANSALFGFSHQIDSIHQATISVGLDLVKALSMTVAMRAYVKNALKIPALRRCWRHSMACAVLSSELAQLCKANPDAAYTAGLLHDIGRLALLATYPQEYANVLDVSAEHAIDLLDCEREIFDIDHCQAGVWLASEWKLPADLVQVIGHHHDSDPPAEFNLSEVVRIACLWTEALDFGVIRARNPMSFPELQALLPEHARDRMLDDPESLKQMILSRLEALS